LRGLEELICRLGLVSWSLDDFGFLRTRLCLKCPLLSPQDCGRMLWALDSVPSRYLLFLRYFSASVAFLSFVLDWTELFLFFCTGKCEVALCYSFFRLLLVTGAAELFLPSCASLSKVNCLKARLSPVKGFEGHILVFWVLVWLSRLLTC